MQELSIDIETYSSHDLPTCGVYRYAEAPDFAILLLAYSIDGGAVECCDLASGEELPAEVMAALRDPAVTKRAYNAAFERVCIARHFGLPDLDPAQWRCTMVAAARMGLPLGLDQCAQVLELEAQKMKEGRALIRYFSTPTRGRRHLPADDPERWALFKAYNVRDVEVEMAIWQKVRRLEVPDFDQRLYTLDQRINDRGVLLDATLATHAAEFDTLHKARLLDEARAITGLDNPNSATQLKEFIRRTCGLRVEAINKQNIDELAQQVRFNRPASRALELRREMARTSTKKYSAMLDCVCGDGRLRGLLQFYGAARTGRWAGRLVQVQNLPQNHLPDLDLARRVVRSGDYDSLDLYYADPLGVLSQLIRTALVARPGCTLHVCDFSAIEARVIAWLAGEEWVVDVFRKGGDIYCATAGQMFGCTVEKHGPNAHLRQKGKIAVLALGYGGGVNALKAMGGERMGLSESEMRDIMTRWREANPRIVRLWTVIERAAIRAIEAGETIAIHRGIEVSYRWGALLVRLPSGRHLCYPRARVVMERGAWADRPTIEHEGPNQTTKRWETLRTYGGKLTENVVQAIARDILGEKLLALDAEGFATVFHVHDEAVVEATPDQSLGRMEAIFAEPIGWCRELPLQGAGYSTPYYLKD